MVGDGIRADFTVTDSGKDSWHRRATTRRLIDAATDAVRRLRQGPDRAAGGQTHGVRRRRTRPATTTRPARSYAAARVHWERIEPVAESFGDLDPKMDLREADLEEGQEWTGWHRIEKDLWPPAERLHAR